MNFHEPDSIVQNFWGITPESVLELSGGQSTQNWKITKDGEDYVLRNAGMYHDYVDMQIDVLLRLQKAGFPYEVPRPLRSMDGNRKVVTELGSYILYPFILGTTGHDNPNYSELGSLLGSYHKSVYGFDFSRYTQRRSKDLLDTHRLREGLLSVEKNIATSDCRPLAEQVIESAPLISAHLGKLARHLQAPLDKQTVCHGDPHINNMVFTEGRVTGLIDFGGITIDPPITDVAACIARLAIVDQELKAERYEEIVTGYQDVVDDVVVDESVLAIAFLGTLRSFIWQISELVYQPNTRVTTQEAQDFLSTLITLAKID